MLIIIILFYLTYLKVSERLEYLWYFCCQWCSLMLMKCHCHYYKQADDKAMVWVGTPQSRAHKVEYKLQYYESINCVKSV